MGTTRHCCRHILRCIPVRWNCIPFSSLVYFPLTPLATLWKCKDTAGSTFLLFRPDICKHRFLNKTKCRTWLWYTSAQFTFWNLSSVLHNSLSNVLIHSQLIFEIIVFQYLVPLLLILTPQSRNKSLESACTTVTPNIFQFMWELKSDEILKKYNMRIRMNPVVFSWLPLHEPTAFLMVPELSLLYLPCLSKPGSVLLL